MAEEEPTTADNIKAKIGTRSSGVAVGKDIAQQTVIVEKAPLDDLRTDVYLIKNDINDLKFAQYDMRARIEDLRREMARFQITPQGVTVPQIVTMICLIILTIAGAMAITLYLSGALQR